MDAVTRTCKDCLAKKLLAEFPLDRDRPRPRCLECYNKTQRPRNRERNRKRYNNPEYRQSLKGWQRRWNRSPKGRTTRNKYRRKQLENPVFAFADRLSSLLRDALNKRGLKKNGRTRELVGYTPEELFEHLRTFINKPCRWCGVELFNWRGTAIDHIVPLRTASTKEDVLKLNALKNLRLLHIACNTEKGGRLPPKPSTRK